MALGKGVSWWYERMSFLCVVALLLGFELILLCCYAIKSIDGVFLILLMLIENVNAFPVSGIVMLVMSSLWVVWKGL